MLSAQAAEVSQDRLVAPPQAEAALANPTPPPLGTRTLGLDSRSSTPAPKTQRPLIFWKTEFPGQRHSSTSDDRNPDPCLYLALKEPGMGILWILPGDG